MRILTIALVAATFLSHPGTALARNIVVTNDDGLTSNVVALYHALMAKGHDVIVSVPCTNQSGMGAAIKIGKPLTPLTGPCLNDAAKAGDAGAGPMKRRGLGKDFHYVDGTPIMAVSYGLDILAKDRWGVQPDLVLSGPNEGQNVGAIILSSGTVSAAQYSAVHGLPAIALSAGSKTEDAGLANAASAVVGGLAADLVDALDKKAQGGRLLPRGIALNVNFPDNLDRPIWRASRIGTYNAYKLSFTKSMSKNATPTMKAKATAHGFDLPDLPGLAFGMNDAQPDMNQGQDEAVVYKNAIAVSPMQAGYEFEPKSPDWLNWYLQDFLTVSGK